MEGETDSEKNDMERLKKACLPEPMGTRQRVRRRTHLQSRQTRRTSTRKVAHLEEYGEMSHPQDEPSWGSRVIEARAGEGAFLE